MMKANKQIGFIYKDSESIDRILKDGEVVFERGFLREKTTTTLPITFGGVGKDLKDYKVYGNTYQNSTSGKNLYNYKSSDLDNDIDNLTVSLDKDGYLIINGTNNKNDRTPIKGIDITDLLEDGQTYTIYQEDITPSDITNNFSKVEARVARTKLNGTIEYPRTNGKHTARITVDKTNYTKYKINVVLPQAGDTYSNYKNRFMLLKGSYNDDNVPSFEPYTGGQPSPNPDYPQEIISCGDRAKNLCGELEQGGYDVNTGEKIVNASQYRNSNFIKVSPNTNYIFSINSSGQAINVLEYKLDGTYIGRIGTTAIQANNYFTTSSETAYINIFRGTSAGIEKWQIEQNDTITSYEPYYEGYKIPVNVRSDNLFNLHDNPTYPSEISILENYMTFDYNNTGTSNVERQIYTNNLNLKPSTNYLCVAEIIEVSGDGTFRPITRWNAQNQGQFNYDDAGFKFDDLQPGQKKVFIATTYANLEEKTRGLRTMCVFAPGEQGHLKVRISIIKDTTITENNFKYQPYYNETTNIYLDEPLRKTKDGTYVDYIDFINGKIVRQLGEVVFDGSENWVLADIVNNISQFDYSNNLIKIFTQYNNISLFANYFGTTARWNKSWSKDNIALHRVNNNKIRIQSSNFTTLEDFKTWLSTHNTIVDYVLATPTEESITLPNIPTVDGNNTLNIETEITPSQVYIKYKSNT